MIAPLDRLAEWYLTQCDGDWEHSHGPRISTLDNPGWSVSVPLVGTSLAGAPFEPVKVDRSGHDWIHCTVEDGRFEARGGPLNLEELVRLFTDWASLHELPSRVVDARHRHGLR